MANTIERLIRIYNRLRRGPVTIEVISLWIKNAGININTRQLYRDLNKLQHLQFAEGENVVEYSDEKNRKIWKLEFDESEKLITQYDINSFFLFKNFIPACIQNNRKDSLQKFEHIIYRDLSKNKYQRLIEANELYLKKTSFNDNFYGVSEHTQIEDLIWSLHNKRMIVIQESLVNPSNINETQYPLPLKFCPVELLFHMGRIYIAGLDLSFQKLLIYPIDKFFKFELTNEPFNRKKLQKPYASQLNPRFGITEPIGKKVYHIKVEYTAEYATSMMNFYWHSTQQWKLMRNGHYMLELNCCINRELIGFLSMGLDKIKIHHPKVLINLLVKKLSQTIEVYEKPKGINEEVANKDYG